MALYNPQSLPTGCRVITINSVTYKENSENKNTPTQKTNVTDEVGAPLGVLMQADFKTITMELQLATEATPVPTTAPESTTTGTFTLDGSTWAIETVSEPREKLGQRVVQITAQRNVS
jgi:hypothetical protein